MEGNEILLRPSIQVKEYVHIVLGSHKAVFGRSLTALSFPGYLESLGQQRLTNDLRLMLSRDSGLRAASERYYVQGGGGGGRLTGGGYGGGDALMSDFSDFSD